MMRSGFRLSLAAPVTNPIIIAKTNDEAGMSKTTTKPKKAHNAPSKRYVALEWLLADDQRMAAVGARFWEKVDMSGDCWMWTASLTSAGYGRFKVKSYHSVPAHRVAFALANHEHPKNMLVLHSCDNPTCVNPKHLRLGTAKDNTEDMFRRGRNRTGDQSGENNGNAKLTEVEVLAIKGMIAEGRKNTHIAPEFGVTHQLISQIRRGKIWGDVELPQSPRPAPTQEAL
jgi:hypothetical protein